MSLVARIDSQGNPTDPAIAEVIGKLTLEEGRLTNMKATLLHSGPAFDAFSGWKAVKAAVRDLVGDHGVAVFSHAISTKSGCLLCSAYFRRILKSEGLDPDSWQPEGDDALLVELGQVIGEADRIGAELGARLKGRFGDVALVNLTAYGATMLATNAFNTALGIAIDDYLLPYQG